MLPEEDQAAIVTSHFTQSFSVVFLVFFSHLLETSSQLCLHASEVTTLWRYTNLFIIIIIIIVGLPTVSAGDRLIFISRFSDSDLRQLYTAHMITCMISLTFQTDQPAELNNKSVSV